MHFLVIRAFLRGRIYIINGRAVNPLTVKLPGTSSGMSSAERKQFLVRVREAEKMLKPELYKVRSKMVAFLPYVK